MSVPHNEETPTNVVDALVAASWSAVVAVHTPAEVGCINTTSSKSNLWMIKSPLKK